MESDIRSHPKCVGCSPVTAQSHFDVSSGRDTTCTRAVISYPNARDHDLAPKAEREQVHMSWLVGLTVAGSLVVALGLTVRWLIGSPAGLARTVLTGLFGFFVIIPSVFVMLGSSGVLDLESVAESDTAPVGALAVLVVAALWVLALGAAVLAVSESLWPADHHVGFFRRALHARDGWRRTARYLEILRVATRHGLGPLLRGHRADVGDVGPALVAALTDAGATFVKLGQVLATRRDVVSPALARHLSTLHSQVAPEPWSTIEAIITRELGEAPSALFQWIDQRPLAAASIGQVHAATLHGGRDVVVKVQRPLAAIQVRTDLDIALRLAKGLERRSALARSLRMTRLVGELADSLREELDYRSEVRNLRLVASAGDPEQSDLRIPAVHSSLSSKRVLTTDRVDGAPLSDARVQLASTPPEERHRLALSLVDGALTQILVNGIFHADLHPGNIMLRSDGTLGIIDFGAIGILTREQRESLLVLLACFRAGDAASAVIAIRRLTSQGPRHDSESLQREVGELFTVARVERDIAELSGRLLRLLSRQGLAIPGYLAAALRTIATLQQAIHALEPRFDYVHLVLDRVMIVLRDPRRLAEMPNLGLARTFTAMLVAGRLMDAIDNSLNASVGDVRLSVGELDERRYRLRVRAAFGGCGLAVCTAAGGLLLIIAGTGPTLPPGIPLLSLVGSALGAVAVLVGTRSTVILARLLTTPTV